VVGGKSTNSFYWFDLVCLEQEEQDLLLVVEVEQDYWWDFFWRYGYNFK
jgi:hypothetical protein